MVSFFAFLFFTEDTLVGVGKCSSFQVTSVEQLCESAEAVSSVYTEISMGDLTKAWSKRWWVEKTDILCHLESKYENMTKWWKPIQN